jgi:PAS domain S-box-containing protein
MLDATAEPLSILHVDDNPGMGEVVRLYLEREGTGPACRVTTAQSPVAALDRLRADDTDFDCVISDYEMPGMNGIEFLEAVRETHPTLPFLLFSSTDASTVAPEVIGAGLTDYLQKGADSEQYTMLVRRLEHAVEGGGRFDAASETVLEGVGVIGSDGRFQQVDSSYASLYGYTPEEVVGRHWSELHPEDEVEHIRTHVIPIIQRGGQWSGRSRGLRADGTTFTESKLVSALDDERILITVSALDDEQTADEQGE